MAHAMSTSAQRRTAGASAAETPEGASPPRTPEPASPPSGEQALLDSWRDLLDQHARITCALERVLQDEHGLGVSEFEVMERLAAPDKEQHRMQELADSVHLSQSALSRLIGRLESEGLVTRAICSEDRRGIYAGLTEEGRARYEAARPTQRRVLADSLG
jgi:DNA-binding MarR family transcriptional regulator